MRHIPEEFLSIKEKLISKLKETENGCLEWTGAIYSTGYGFIYSSGLWSGKRSQYLAHRVFYFLETGVQPSKLMVCHRCDNPPCCNPKHLFLGTNMDNLLDSMSKGRRYKAGPFELSTKITREIFDAIKMDYESTSMTLVQLAKKHGVNKNTLCSAFIKNGVRTTKSRKRRFKLTEDCVIEIRRLKFENTPAKEIAKTFSISLRTVNQVYSGETWGHIRTPYDPPNFKGK